MTTFDLFREGYVVNYLTTGAIISDFKPPFTDKNQLRFESEMRKTYNIPCTEKPVWGSLDEPADIGGKWSFYAGNKNPYVNFSTFYFTLTDVKLHAITQLVSEKAQTVRARLWSYARVNLWVNGKHAANIDEPVYKPINHCDFEMELSEGVNNIFISMENFGVRDTRNMFSLQLKETGGIRVTLPGDEKKLEELKACEEWLCTLRGDGKKLVAVSVPPVPVSVELEGKTLLWSEGKTFEGEFGRIVTVSFSVDGQMFKRIFDFVENIEIFRDDEKTSYDERRRKNLKDASNLSMNIGKEYAIYFALANYAFSGKFDERDYDRIYASISAVKERIDCADFTLSGLLVALKKTELTEECRAEIKDAALNFRYWMDQDGADAMCFWSENHSLLFFMCQMASGLLWPDEYFPRAGMDGKRQFEEGYRKVNEWFDVIEHEGFEEFLSGYLAVTVTALMLVYIFGDEKLKLRAKNAIDRIVRESCIQCFDGIHLAPMGRVYRGTLAPFTSGIQSLLYQIDGKNARCLGDIWITLVSYSDYTFPEDVKDIIYNDADITLTSGRARISTKKTKGYMLTSVASPRKDPIEECPYKDTQYYDVLLMNEWFHGTSLFVPGEQGYQQHLWYAAISNRCYTFVTHPAVEKDLADGEMRPDYWYGNGIIPGIRQEGSTLYTYFEIPDEYPTKFTHIYWPSFAMEEEKCEDNFRFARVGDSYMALWCSEELELNNADALMNCDFRAYGDTCAWVVRVGMKEEFGSFENFINEFKRLPLTKENVKNEIDK